MHWGWGVQTFSLWQVRGPKRTVWAALVTSLPAPVMSTASQLRKHSRSWPVTRITLLKVLGLRGGGSVSVTFSQLRRTVFSACKSAVPGRRVLGSLLTMERDGFARTCRSSWLAAPSPLRSRRKGSLKQTTAPTPGLPDRAGLGCTPRVHISTKSPGAASGVETTAREPPTPDASPLSRLV